MQITSLQSAAVAATPPVASRPVAAAPSAPAAPTAAATVNISPKAQQMAQQAGRSGGDGDHDGH